MSRKKSTVEFIEQARRATGTLYDYSITEYHGNKKKVAIRCNKHGIKFMQYPNDHLRGRLGCPACKGEAMSAIKASSKDEFVRKAKIKYGELYDYSDAVYKNERTEIAIICRKHGRFLQTPASHLFSGGCPECSAEAKMNTEAELMELLPHTLSYSSIKKTGRHTDSWIVTGTCQKCGKSVAKTIHYFRYDFKGCRCGRHGYSGESIIAGWLEAHKIKYEKEATFDDFIDKRPLRFDFWIPEHNLLIEHHGEQHCRPKNFGGISQDRARENFELQIKHDGMKKDYAARKNMTLVEIYWKDNIIETLEKIFLTKKK